MEAFDMAILIGERSVINLHVRPIARVDFKMLEGRRRLEGDDGFEALGHEFGPCPDMRAAIDRDRPIRNEARSHQVHKALPLPILRIDRTLQHHASPPSIVMT